MKLDIDTDDFKSLEKLLRRLPDKVQGRVLQRSVTAAIRKGRKEIKASAPVGDVQSAGSLKYGRLSKNIKVGRARNRRKDVKSAFVSTGKAFWGFFLEFGTRKMPARPWFVPAFKRSIPIMLTELRQRIGDGIDKEFNKLK